jgi:hypothetical protein
MSSLRIGSDQPTAPVQCLKALLAVSAALVAFTLIFSS